MVYRTVRFLWYSEGMDTPVVFFAGMDQKAVITLMRACKAAAAEAGLDPAAIAFSMETESNVEWKLRDLLTEVAEEHRLMRERGNLPSS